MMGNDAIVGFLTHMMKTDMGEGEEVGKGPGAGLVEEEEEERMAMVSRKGWSGQEERGSTLGKGAEESVEAVQARLRHVVGGIKAEVETGVGAGEGGLDDDVDYIFGWLRAVAGGGAEIDGARQREEERERRAEGRRRLEQLEREAEREREEIAKRLTALERRKIEAEGAAAEAHHLLIKEKEEEKEKRALERRERELRSGVEARRAAAMQVMRLDCIRHDCALVHIDADDPLPLLHKAQISVCVLQRPCRTHAQRERERERE